MDRQSMITLEYETIKEELEHFAVSYVGKNLIQQLEPMKTLTVIRRALEEAEEARDLQDRGASVPIPSLEGMEWLMSLIGTGYLYSEKDFTAVATFLNSCSQLRKYMASKEQIAPRIGAYASSVMELRHVQDEINRCIRFGVIDDGASKGLERARKRLKAARLRLQRKIEGIMSRHQSILQEQLFSMRNGRYVIPVKREYHKQVKGSVLDQSTSGQTVYVEPDEIAALQNELDLLSAEEAREEAIILSMLTGLVEREQEALRLNIEVTGTYDFIFAKAKYARSIGGIAVRLNEQGILVMNGGRHPMLKEMIPINLSIGKGYQSLIVTGPNTGGKTVVLKTLGLLALMVQSGLLIPVADGSEFPIFTEIMSVIGDGQSLAQSLSTFSAQMKSIEGMLRNASKGVLLLIDELAAGTDPGEGIALSIAILEELSRQGANIIVTTHFNELKSFAAATPGFQNARMEFDKDTLQPLYRLTIGEAGESYALQIAEKLGIPVEVIRRSRQIVEAQQGQEPQAINLWNTRCEAQVNNMEQMTGNESKKERNPYNSGKGQQSTPEGAQSHGEEGQQIPVPRRDFEIGDAVFVSSLGRTGIVYEQRNSLGMVGVMIQKQRLSINHKRLKPYISKEELYPEDYDMDIIFESKENRKKRKLMNRKHVEGLTVELEEER
ncbi:endonuclease MutS2 [Paenibacillus agri]|uniref:DNA mismatch repair protein MutS n=1 Tax=Paenibacillus agri TaxID=2744309 RepID=A0A850EUM3_9BACL|nr:DNA mismatch repair protein MutS [Paenibacillus agri]NUU63094.1 DNA mismatch repair protein MutS [Paenibacillus agri]